jgi:hypothetical protein
MKMRMFLASALVALAASASAVLGAGCGDSPAGDVANCNNLCAQSNMCPGATPTECDKSCASATAVNMASACTVDYEQVLDCAGDQPDVCTTPATACSSQIAAYDACIEAYCLKTPQPAACKTD